MQFYQDNNKGPLASKVSHDPDAKRLYGFFYKPPIWQPNKVYRSDKDIIIPSIFNGFYYTVKSNGISSAVEPVWSTEKGVEINDGSVIFKAVPYTLFLGDGETLINSTWSITDSIPISNETYTANGSSSIMVGNIPEGVTSFTLTNHITKNNNEEDDRSIIIQVGEK